MPLSCSVLADVSPERNLWEGTRAGGGAGGCLDARGAHAAARPRAARHRCSCPSSAEWTPRLLASPRQRPPPPPPPLTTRWVWVPRGGARGPGHAPALTTRAPLRPRARKLAWWSAAGSSPAARSASARQTCRGCRRLSGRAARSRGPAPGAPSPGTASPRAAPGSPILRHCPLVRK
eukprot:scaffold18513_cov101-Isochrysis_galbana.AAC.9